VRRDDVDVVLRDALIALHDPAPDVGAALGVEQGLERGAHGVRLRLEPAGGDEGFELLGEPGWYANRYLNRRA
jgi:hypothetical protein